MATPSNDSPSSPNITTPDPPYPNIITCTGPTAHKLASLPTNQEYLKVPWHPAELLGHGIRTEPDTEYFAIYNDPRCKHYGFSFGTGTQVDGVHFQIDAPTKANDHPVANKHSGS